MSADGRENPLGGAVALPRRALAGSAGAIGAIGAAEALLAGVAATVAATFGALRDARAGRGAPMTAPGVFVVAALARPGAGASGTTGTMLAGVAATFGALRDAGARERVAARA
jgi:hypothetical protein